MKIVFNIALLTAAFLCCLSVYLFFMVFGRKKMPGIPRPRILTQKDAVWECFQKKSMEGEKWLAMQETEFMEIRADDGIRLRADMVWAAEKTGRTIIAVHGYRGTPALFFSGSVKFYHDLGYNVLLVHNRAHGKSEGKYIGFGWTDRLDLCRWCNYLVKYMHENTEIALLGVSMGGAAVMMASGEKLPEQVKCMIADCGYHSLWDQLAYNFPKMFPKTVIMHAVSLLCRVIQGFTFREASALKQLRKNVLPILFIHGDADEFVPVSNAYDAYEAASGDAELLIINGAGHAMCYYTDTDRYEKAVSEFLASNMRIQP